MSESDPNGMEVQWMDGQRVGLIRSIAGEQSLVIVKGSVKL